MSKHEVANIVTGEEYYSTRAVSGNGLSGRKFVREIGAAQETFFLDEDENVIARCHPSRADEVFDKLTK